MIRDNLAAQATVPIANRNPLSTFDCNIRGTYNLLEACRRNPAVKRVIIASSDKAYGDRDVLPCTEDAQLRGLHPYDVSKSCADLIASAYHHTYQLPVCVTRCGNFFGGGDLNFNRIVPGTIRSAILNQRPVIRCDGSDTRDYLYVQDAVEAYTLLAEKMEELSLQGQAFNFSNESRITVLDLMSRILKLMRRDDLEPVVLGTLEGEVRHQSLSARKAREILKWQPEYDVDRGLEETIAWYRGFFESDPRLLGKTSTAGLDRTWTTTRSLDRELEHCDGL